MQPGGNRGTLLPTSGTSEICHAPVEVDFVASFTFRVFSNLRVFNSPDIPTPPVSGGCRPNSRVACQVGGILISGSLQADFWPANNDSMARPSALENDFRTDR